MRKQYFLIPIFFCMGIGASMAQLTDMVTFVTGWPYGSFTLSNKLYGMTSESGIYSEGTIFCIDSTGHNYKVLHNFDKTHGAGPGGSLTLSGTKFFGMTNTGGPIGPNGEGVIFTMDTTGANYKVIFNFCCANGFFPEGDVTLTGSKLYGMASNGGAYSYGVIFTLDTTGTNYKVIHSFNSTLGAGPCGDLTLSGTKFYGMTYQGGRDYKGVIFSMDTDGQNYKILLQFNDTNGGFPYGSVTLSGNKLYGTASYGGAHSDGLIFSIDTDGSDYTILHTFNGSDGSSPWGVLNLSGGVLYGMAPGGGFYNQGVIFSIDTNGANYSILFNFDGFDGGSGYGGLTITGDVFYGLTYYGWDAYHGLAFKFYDTTLHLTITGANVTCSGASNGYAIVNTGGGNEPYTYSWAPISGSTNTLTGLSAGTYTVTVNDIHGYTATDYITIGPPAPLVVSDSAVNVLCNGESNGKAVAKVSGGTSPYTYLWSDMNSQTTATAIGLSVGTYTVAVKDSCGSSATASTTITQPNSLVVTASNTHASCNLPNGSATANISGGTGPYTYSWSGGGGTNSTASNLTAGTYTLTVYDNNGCTGTASTAITQPTAISASASTSANVLCHGENNGSAYSTVSGGTTPYTYLWTGGRTNSTASGLTAGTYILNVYDANGCSGTATTTITQPTVLTVTGGGVNNSSSSCNGTVTANVSGGTPGYNYLWSPGGQTNATATGLCGGTYCCDITDAYGCTASTCVTIVGTGIDELTANSEKVKVYPNPNNGQFTIQLSGLSNQSSVEIYNVLGERIYSQSNIQHSTFNIDLSSQPNGVYFYRVIEKDGSLLGDGKVLVEK